MTSTDVDKKKTKIRIRKMKKKYYNKHGEEIEFEEEMSEMCMSNNNEFELYRKTLKAQGYLK